VSRRVIVRVSDIARQVRRAIDNGDEDSAWSYAVLAAKVAKVQEQSRRTRARQKGR
jgi:ribosome-binding protein aMBF1 (putative translation factor)